MANKTALHYKWTRAVQLAVTPQPSEWYYV